MVKLLIYLCLPFAAIAFVHIFCQSAAVSIIGGLILWVLIIRSELSRA